MSGCLNFFDKKLCLTYFHLSGIGVEWNWCGAYSTSVVLILLQWSWCGLILPSGIGVELIPQLASWCEPEISEATGEHSGWPLL